MKEVKLSSTERAALELLVRHGGSFLVTQVPDANEKEVVFNTVTPGHPVYRKLEKKGFVFYTEEEPMDWPGDAMDGFVFTEEIYLTDEGREAHKQLNSTTK